MSAPEWLHRAVLRRVPLRGWPKVVLVAIADRLDGGGGYRPSLDEIAEEAGCSIPTARAALAALETGGWIAIAGGRGRGNRSRYIINGERIRALPLLRKRRDDGGDGDDYGDGDDGEKLKAAFSFSAEGDDRKTERYGPKTVKNRPENCKKPTGKLKAAFTSKDTEDTGKDKEDRESARAHEPQSSEHESVGQATLFHGDVLPPATGATLLVKEKKSVPADSPTKAKHRIPEAWMPDEAGIALLRESGIPSDRYGEVIEEFVGYWREEAGGAKARKTASGWQRAFRYNLIQRAPHWRRFFNVTPRSMAAQRDRESWREAVCAATGSQSYTAEDDARVLSEMHADFLAGAAARAAERAEQERIKRERFDRIVNGAGRDGGDR